MKNIEGISVYRIDYDMKDSSWNVYIVAYSAEEAMELLFKKVGRNIRVTGTGTSNRIDIMADNVIQDIVDANKPKKRGPGRPPKKKKD